MDALERRAQRNWDGFLRATRLQADAFVSHVMAETLLVSARLRRLQANSAAWNEELIEYTENLVYDAKEMPVGDGPQQVDEARKAYARLPTRDNLARLILAEIRRYNDTPKSQYDQALFDRIKDIGVPHYLY